MKYEPIPPRDVSDYSPMAHGARCDLCPLKDNVYVPAMPPAKGRVKFVIVGEGPGRKEEIQRRPFVGVTGERLTEELIDVGLDRDEAWVTNATMCASDNEKENERAGECCAPRLLKELAALPADVPILPLGKAATKAVLGVKSILLARGFVWKARELSKSIDTAEAAHRKLGRLRDAKTKSGAMVHAARAHAKLVDAKLRIDTLKARNVLQGRTVLPTLHPTFAFIHNETWAPIFHIDIARAARWIRGELTEDMLEDRIELVKSLSALRKRKRTFIVTDNVDEILAASTILGQEIGCDIETERIKPLSPLKPQILCVQLSDGDRSVVIAPWDPKRHAKVLTTFLKGRTVVFHNGFCFDQIALERKDQGVSFKGVTLEDTLTAHHAFASQYPQKLDHVVSTFLDSSPWKIRFGVRGAEEKGLAPQALDGDDLYIYGAADAVLTIKVWRAMQADLAPEWAVYEHDKRRSLLYKHLQVVGYHVDRKRRRLLSKKLKQRAAALKGRLRRICGKPTFQPSKLDEVRKVLFGTLKAPVLNPTPTGLAGTSNATLESLRTGDSGEDETRQTRVGLFAEGMLNWRITVKVRSTYVDPVDVHPDGRAHYNFKPFGVLTGRPASRILSAPRWSRALTERAREQYTAAPGHWLLYFDLAQAEGRFAANLSNDAGLIESCRVDLHTRNALILFGADPVIKDCLTRDPKGKHCPRHSEKGSPKAACNCGKPFRDVTKNVGFAILYQAGPKKVMAFLRSQGFPVELSQVEDMFIAMRDAYPDYARYVAENIRYVERNGHLRTALVGRIMWFGFHPEPAQVANVPVQSGIADVMDTRLLDVMVPSMPYGCNMILHHYDSATFEVPNKYIDWKKDEKGNDVPCGPAVEVIERTWKEPIRLKESIVCRTDREFILPADVKVAKRWSDF